VCMLKSRVVELKGERERSKLDSCKIYSSTESVFNTILANGPIQYSLVPINLHTMERCKFL